MMSEKIILDISRLYSRRFYQHDTGIDRVERAYLEGLQKTHDLVLCLRQGRMVFLFPTIAFAEIMQIHNRGNRILPRLRRFMNLHKIAQKGRMPQKLSHHSSATYLNVGHSTHPDWFWQKLKKHQISIGVMVHDVIPLDFPELTREDQIEPFKKKFKLWLKYADWIITPSQYSRERILAHAGQEPKVFAVPLGINVSNIPIRECENAWLVIGTIEPRKNHLFLIDLWERMAREGTPNIPKLWIIGGRGWNLDEIGYRLDNSPLNGDLIFELGALTDIEMNSYYARAKGILFPSLCEGFGLPLYEAIMMEKPIIASDIPAFRESLEYGNPCLISLNDTKAWQDAILSTPEPPRKPHEIMSWNTHLNRVNTIRLGSDL